MKIKFLVAAGTVTGSCYQLISNSGQSIMIDCGMFQGSPDLEARNYDQFDCDCSQLSGLVLTHAHLDHCGRLPRLLNQGFRQPIWMTEPTKDLTELSLFDSAKINKEDREDPLYDQNQVEEIISHFRTIDYERPFNIDDFEVIMRDASHILGSASLEITDLSDQHKIVFSGDLGNTPQEIIRATEYIHSGESVVMESTYGDSSHPSGDASQAIQGEINEIEKSGGTLLIPAFSIERSQELLHRIAHLKKAARIKPETTVFFDSPMALKATQIFEKYREFFNEEFKHDFQIGDPFSFPGLMVVENRRDAKDAVNFNGPKIIIAGSGMMTGGRIVAHAATYLPKKSTRILFVGYQAEETLGREISSGQKLVVIQGKTIVVNAAVNQIQTLSSHADQPRLINWLKQIRGVKNVILTHGEDGPRQTLAEKIRTDLKIEDVVLPNHNQLVDF